MTKTFWHRNSNRLNTCKLLKHFGTLTKTRDLKNSLSVKRQWQFRAAKNQNALLKSEQTLRASTERDSADDARLMAVCHQAG